MTTTPDVGGLDVDFLILADRAEAVNGKLYMMGGGWDRIWVPDFAKPHPLSIAVGVVVPWSATNEKHSLSVRVEANDGQELATYAVQFTTGRPPFLREAQSQRIILSFHGELTLPSPGTYAVRGIIDNDT
ncbi:MAG: hypothetical protein WEC33_07020, partial [Dehalococcoidia bacterium]